MEIIHRHKWFLSYSVSLMHSSLWMPCQNVLFVTTPSQLEDNPTLFLPQGPSCSWLLELASRISCLNTKHPIASQLHRPPLVCCYALNQKIGWIEKAGDKKGKQMLWILQIWRDLDIIFVICSCSECIFLPTRLPHEIHETCNSVTFYFMSELFSDISMKCIFYQIWLGWLTEKRYQTTL